MKVERKECIYCKGNNTIYSGGNYVKCKDCNRFFTELSNPQRRRHNKAINGFKICSKCGHNKPIKNFHKKYGKPRSQCIMCENEYPDNTRFKKFGITKKIFLQMLEDQWYCCLICCDPLSPRGHSTHIYHCHLTGKIRGLLCNNCNAILGFAKDNVKILQKAIYYLKK